MNKKEIIEKYAKEYLFHYKMSKDKDMMYHVRMEHLGAQTAIWNMLHDLGLNKNVQDMLYKKMYKENEVEN